VAEVQSKVVFLEEKVQRCCFEIFAEDLRWIFEAVLINL